MEYYSAVKKIETMKLGKWMELENIILIGETDTERQMLNVFFSHLCSLSVKFSM